MGSSAARVLLALLVGVIAFALSAQMNAARGLATKGSPVRAHTGGGPDPYLEQPLDDLDPQIGAFIASRQGSIGVAVLVPGRGTVYSWNGGESFALASIAKVHIMLALLEAVAFEERDLTDEEASLLDWMITVSDNDSASLLWDALGGGEAIAIYLYDEGESDLEMPADFGWGSMAQPARGTAGLFARLISGQGLYPSSRDAALHLLSRVDSSQRWGITAGLDFAADDPPLVYMKDGWYPDEIEGWRVNSAGIIVPRGGEPYVLVIFTSANDAYDYGVETVEGIASLVNAVLGGGTPRAYALSSNKDAAP